MKEQLIIFYYKLIGYFKNRYYDILIYISDIKNKKIRNKLNKTPLTEEKRQELLELIKFN